MAEKLIIDLQVNSNIQDTSKKVDGLKTSVNDAKTSVKGFKNETEKINTGAIDKLGGSLSNLSPAFKNGITSAKQLGSQLLLLAANPIVAVTLSLVAAVGLLFKAFSSTKAGADQLSQVMAGLSSVVDVVRDRILNVGNAIVKFFSGDFKGALNEGKKAISGFSDEVVGEFKKAANATKDLQQVEDAFNRLSVSRAKVNRDLAISKELLTDENASFEEKRKALEKIKITEGKQTEQELANAKKKFEAIKALNALSDTSRENKKKEQEAEAALFALQEQSARDRRAINKQEKTLLNQQKAAEKEAADKRKAQIEQNQAEAKVAYDKQKVLLEESLKDESLNFEQRRKLVSDNLKLSDADRKKINEQINNEEKKSIEQHNKAIADLEKKLDDEKANRLADTAVKKEQLDFDRRVLEIEKLTSDTNERNALIEKLDSEHKIRMGIAQEADNKKAIDENKIKEDKITADKKAAEEARRNINNIAIQSAQGLVGILAGLGEKNKKIQKAALIANGALSIAEIINNTNTGASKEVATKGIFGLSTSAVLYAKMAISIGSVIAATAKGLSSLGGGSAPSRGGDSSGGGSNAPVSQPPAFNVVGASNTNQLADAIGGQAQQPIKAFVVSNDVTTAQSMDRNIVSGASI